MKALKTLDNWISGVAMADPKVFDDGDCRRLQEIADEIRDEVKRFYIPLPLDADLVPIRVGDVLKNDISGEKQVWMVSANGFAVYGDCSEYNPKAFRHVKYRTLEDVLEDFAYKVCDLNVNDDDIARYAKEIRELLGVSDD